MDKDAKRIELESQQRELENYLSNPVTVELLRDLNEGSEALVSTLCNEPIVDIEAFFKHFEAIGHLRGLRRAKTLITTNLEDVKEAINELESE